MRSTDGAYLSLGSRGASRATTRSAAAPRTRDGCRPARPASRPARAARRSRASRARNGVSRSRRSAKLAREARPACAARPRTRRPAARVKCAEDLHQRRRAAGGRADRDHARAAARPASSRARRGGACAMRLAHLVDAELAGCACTLRISSCWIVASSGVARSVGFATKSTAPSSSALNTSSSSPRPLDHDHRRRRLRHQQAQEREAVHARHLEVERDQVRTAARAPCAAPPRRRAPSRRPRPAASVSSMRDDRAPAERRVVDHEHADAGSAPSCARLVVARRADRGGAPRRATGREALSPGSGLR